MLFVPFVVLCAYIHTLVGCCTHAKISRHKEIKDKGCHPTKESIHEHQIKTAPNTETTFTFFAMTHYSDLSSLTSSTLTFDFASELTMMIDEVERGARLSP